MVDAASLLARIAERPEAAAILLDVDGTLAPIVARPEDARVPDQTREELRRLAGRYTRVACVSGRPGEVAARIVGVDGIRYVGEHGLELEPQAGAWAARLAAFAHDVDWPAEGGKRLTLSFHFRSAPEGEAYLGEVAEASIEVELIEPPLPAATFATDAIEVRPFHAPVIERLNGTVINVKLRVRVPPGA